MISNDLKNLTIVAQDLKTPLRLDIFLSQNMAQISRSLAGKIITSGACEVNGKIITKSSTIIQNNDVIKVLLPHEKKMNLEPQNIPLDIVYEDEDIIVINKAFGMVVHPSIGHPDGTLVNALLFHCKNLSMGFHEHRPGIVHRLDKETGGLIVVAKTQAAHTHLAEQFKNKTAGRIYKALTFNKFKNESGTVESYFIRHPKNRLKYTSTQNSNQGKWAKTHFEALKNGPVSLVKLKLETGRTHQIRIHLSEMGNPIINDEIYGSENMVNNLQNARLKSMIKKSDTMFLFAEELHIIHPRSHEPMSFKVPLPKSFNTLIDFLNAEESF